MHIRHKRIRFLAGVAAATLILGARPSLAATAPQQIDLPQQNLADELRAIARATGRDIMFASDAVGDRPGKPLHGMMTADQAVDHLLAGSNLTADHRADGILIRGRPDAREADATASAPSNDIVVTGSRIRGAPSASPTVVLSQTQIEDAGQTTVADALRALPQNYGGGQNPGVAGGGDQGGNQNINSASTINLRGLGADATLTLIKERVEVQLVSLSCVDFDDHSVVDQSVKGFFVDADGKKGLSGQVITRAGATLARAFIAGTISGISQSVQDTFGENSVSALGSVRTLNPTDSIKTGVAGGLSKSSDKLTDFYLGLARQAGPIVEVGAGKDVTVVVQEGVTLEIKPTAGVKF